MKSSISGIALAQRQVPFSAVVFYSEKQGEQAETQFATYHSLRESGGKFELAAGAPLTGDNLKKIASMASAGLRHKTEILPENVLAATDDILVWWMPASRQHMHFDVSMHGENETRQRLQGVNGKVPIPALVFVLKRSKQTSHAYTGINVFALAENMRPSASTQLYRAPVLNVDSSGGVCWGSGMKPKGTGVADIAAWQSLFFSSVFTHFNGSSPIRGDDCYGFIADMLEAQTTDFPIDRLVPMKTNLQETLNVMGGDRG